jgi:sarcosine oxidase
MRAAFATLIRASVSESQNEDVAMPAIDVVVVGLGITGSAALYALARRGSRVVGIERFSPGHERGSSHGETRIIRLGYFEHPSYVPLVRAALPLWRDLEVKSGQSLLHITGVVEIGAPESALVAGTLGASREHALPHEVLDAETLMQRFPAFQVPSHFLGIFQPDGGFLRAEAAIHAHIALARDAGAEIRTGATVRAVVPRNGGVSIETEVDVIEAGAAVVAAGPWMTTLLPDLPLHVTRQVLAWFVPSEPARFAHGACPVFLLESEAGCHYGLPIDERGALKIAKHHHLNETVGPDNYNRAVSKADEAAIRGALAGHLPSANGRLLAAKTCLYTLTPDGDFILDHLPGHPEIVVASACSGHGFKFAPVVGEILADLATVGGTSHDISRFQLSRFGGY